MNNEKYTKEYVISELAKRGFVLFSKFTNVNDKHNIIDNNKYKYYTSPYSIITDYSRPEPINKNNPFVIDNIKQYIINNNITSEYESGEYTGSTSKLSWICECGKIFIRSWTGFHSGSNICQTCAVRKSGKYDREKEWELIKQHFNSKNLILLTNKYDNGTAKLEYKCPNHLDKGVLTVTWAQCKSKNTGCPYCANEKNGEKRRVSEDEVKENILSKNMIYDHIEYINGRGFAFFKCPVHINNGMISMTVSDVRSSKILCPYCSHHIRDGNEVINEICSLHPNIIIHGKYINMTTKIECECLLDGYIWNPTPNGLLSGTGCPKCGRIKCDEARLKSNEQFIYEINKRFDGNIDVLSPYTGSHNNQKFRCNIDGTVFESTPTSLLSSKYGCPTCVGRATSDRCRKTNNQFIYELNKINPNIIPLESYISDHDKILCTCKIHSNYKWMALPNKILRKNTGCPKCTASSNENKIAIFLDSFGFNYTQQKRFTDCRDINILPFDFYLKDNKVAIEYDGEHHYIPIRRGEMTENDAIEYLTIVKRHDEIKTTYCNNNNIILIRIPYWESEDLENYLFDQLLKYKILELVA